MGVCKQADRRIESPQSADLTGFLEARRAGLEELMAVGAVAMHRSAYRCVRIDRRSLDLVCPTVEIPLRLKEPLDFHCASPVSFVSRNDCACHRNTHWDG
jgi:hypothetical protein